MQSLPSIGAIIDETYEIKSLLGKGGFGAVYLSRHIPMEREVALKLLLPQGHNPAEMVQRFRREVMAIRNLAHPNTVRIFDYRDSEEDTLIYYTMEYLKGETLKDVVRREGPQPPRRVAHIIKQIMKSLAEAHSMGIVHRDLKPANIMLVEMYGEQDFVKVLDFGIAKVMEQEDDEDEPLTSAGMLVGTLRYMSPEQIKGLPLGPYTDIYALGLITIEMIIGQSVFAGTGRWEILQKQVSPEPIHFPPELDHSPLRPVLERMLAKDSAHRYPNAETLLRDLNSIPPGTLSDVPLINNRANLPPLPGHHSASNISHSAPSTPPPVALDQAPTTISELNTIVPQHVHVGPAGHPMQGVAAPTLPMHAVTAPQPAPAPVGFISETGQIAPPATSFGQDDSFIVAKPTTSKTPLFIGAGVVALLLIGGGAFAISSMTTGEPADVEKPKQTAMAAVENTASGPPTKAPLDEAAPSDELAKEEAAPEPPPAPQKVELTLETAGVKQAKVFLDDEELGPLPLTRELAEGQSETLVIKAEGFEALSVTLDDESPDTMPIALKAVPPKKVDPPAKTQPRQVTRKPPKPKPKEEKDPLDWADVTPKKPVKKKPKIEAFGE